MKKLLQLFFLLFSTAFINAQTCDFIQDHNGNVNQTLVDCNFTFNNSCIVLNSQFPPLHATNAYQVESKSYAPVGNFTDGVPLNANSDDNYIRRINFNDFGENPFLFNFFGEITQSILISSNGFISFSESYFEGDYSNPLLDNQTIPSNFLPGKSIFGVFQDLIFSTSNDSEIYVNMIGEYPCRKLVINFYKARFTGNDQMATFQIVLHELNSKIEINVLSKPLPQDNIRFKSSLIGIVNQNGEGYAAPNRNTGIWSAENESYLFSPNGNLVSPQNITWSNTLDSNTTTSNTLNVCTLLPAVYTATAVYNFNGVLFSVKDKHEIRFAPNFPLAKDYTEVICSTTPPLTQARFYSNINSQTNHSLFVYKFYLNRNDAQSNATNFLNPNQLLETNQIYYVRIENRNNPSCFSIAVLDLRSTITFPPVVEVCDTYNDREEDLLLSTLNCQLFPNLSNVTNIRYYINNQTTPVTRAILTTATKIRVQYNLPDCTDLLSSEINVRFINSPQVITNEMDFNSYEELFDIITNNNPIKREPYIWEEELERAGIVLSNEPEVTIKAFLNLEDALENRNPINYIKEGEEVDDYRYIMYFRVEGENRNCKGFCGNIITVNARVKFQKIILNIDDADPDNPADDPLVYDMETVDFYLCGTTTYERNLLDDVRSTIIVTTPNLTLDDLLITFHENYTTANNVENLGIDPNVVITANKTYYVRLEIPLTEPIDPDIPARYKYVVKPMVYTLVPTTPLVETIDICVDYRVTEKTIVLNDYINQLLPAQYLNLNPPPVFTFYSDASGTNVITNLNVTANPQQIWVKIKYLQTENVCELISPLTFKLISNDGILRSDLEINLECDNNNDNQEWVNLNNYITEFVTNPADYTIAFFRNYNSTNNTFSNPIANPSRYSITENTVIYMQITQNEKIGICSQKVEIKINFSIIPEHIIRLKSIAHLLMCNETNSPFVYFNLEESISQLYLDSNPSLEENITSIRYYENQEDAEEGNENFIQNYNQYGLESDRPRATIYARYENQFGCYSVAPIQLEIIGLIKLKPDLKFDICDTNLDGIYHFNLREWVNQAITDEDTTNDLLLDEVTNRLATYKFYLNLNDFNNGIALTPEQESNFEFNPNIHQTIILGATIAGGCNDHIPVQINYIPFDTFEYQFPELCDINNDQLEVIDLTLFEVNHPNSTFTYYSNYEDLISDQNPIVDPSAFEYTSVLGNKIYFRIESETLSCYNLGIINIELKETPIVTIDDYKICPTDSITIAPDVSQWNIISFEWWGPNGEIISTQNQITITQQGSYQLILTAANGCTYTETFEITHFDLPVIEQIIFQQTSATVIASGDRNILYSMDGNNWQTSNTFDNLAPGLYTFYIKYENENCVVGPVEGIIPLIYNTISPNGDGINDRWVIRNLHVFNGQMAKLEIFDRYGKKLYTQESNTEFVWDGKWDGKPLPSTSYWYTILFPDGRKYTGYINVLNKY